MVPRKSLDEVEIIAALLHDVHKRHGLVFNTRSQRLTTQVVRRRIRTEGLGFLMKTLPRLAKTLDKSLGGTIKMNAAEVGFSAYPGCEFPRFLGEFFKLIYQPDGSLLPSPCAISIAVIRQICLVFYKYEKPYTDEQEQQVIRKFKETENDLSTRSTFFKELEKDLELITSTRRKKAFSSFTPVDVLREAKILLSRLFSSFDPKDIYPRHGPGAVATKQKLWGKYLWTNVSANITKHYPLDEYFYSSLSHVCDDLDSLSAIQDKDLPARVILVPKDSRGPRLISCEPVDYQWVQQGLGRAIVELVEKHPLTRWNVFFTDQEPNRMGALDGSYTGGHVTLDLNEASDRVHLDLVRLLFPSHVLTYLEACRSSSTELPDGEVIKLNKFAPMGSCLCFPILALTVWAILAASAPDAYTRKSILVYGDDVIVTTANAANAIEQLESFGLKVNRDKSCTSGLFRESCGMDAFNGTEVTPVRFRTVWSSSPSPESYSSWIAYANSMYDKKYYSTYDYIVGELNRLYGSIPGEDMHLACPSLRDVPDTARPKSRRWNKNLQKFEYRVFDLKSPSFNHRMNGWSMLLRYFSESVGRPQVYDDDNQYQGFKPLEAYPPFSVSQYTQTGCRCFKYR
jgi:hypothetical protein